MKKILYFIPTFSVISETFILREVQTLIELGNLDIRILSLQEGTASVPSQVKEKVIYFRPSIKDILFSLPFIILNLGRILTTSKIVFYENEGTFSKNFKTFVKSIFYAKYISKFKVNHIHSHFVSEPSTLMMFVAEILNLPFSISGHATDVFRDHDMVKAKSKRAKFVALCNSQAYLEFIKLSGGKGKKNVVLLYHGIDYLKFKFKKRDLFKAKKIKILTDARFVEKKGLKILSQAVVDLNQIMDVSLTIVGLAQNEEQERYRDLIIDIFEKSKLKDKLNIPNNGKGVQIEDVIQIYSESDVFVYAGIDAGKGDVDGVPNALLQAAFSGLPVITTLSGSISDLFDEKNSYIIIQNDSKDITMKFQEMLIDKNRDEKSEQLFNQASKEFSLFLNIKELEELLNK